LFYDEFYLTGTTMHTMPGLPVLHSKDLVNWEFLGYAFDKLNLGPDFRLEKGAAGRGRHSRAALQVFWRTFSPFAACNYEA